MGARKAAGPGQVIGPVGEQVHIGPVAAEALEGPGAVHVGGLLQQADNPHAEQRTQHDKADGAPPATQAPEPETQAPQHEQKAAENADRLAANPVDQVLRPPLPGAGTDEVVGYGVEGPGPGHALVKAGGSGHGRKQQEHKGGPPGVIQPETPVQHPRYGAGSLRQQRADIAATTLVRRQPIRASGPP